MSRKNIVTIILNYNTPEQSLSLAHQVNKLGYKVVIVDNCSTDNSRNFIQDGISNLNCCDLVCAKENGGYAKGNNIGILYALSKWDVDYIAIMNPDIELLHENTLDNLCDELDKDETLAGITALTLFNRDMNANNSCAARLLTPKELIFSDLFFFNKFIRRNYKDLKGNNNLVSYVDKIQGCFFVVKRQCFENINFFDEHTFLYFEEDIIGYKIKSIGLKLGVLLSETIHHNHGIKDGEMNNKAKRIFYNKCMLESKKYYMLNILKVNPIIWKVSYMLDSTTRKIKDIWS